MQPFTFYCAAYVEGRVPSRPCSDSRTFKERATEMAPKLLQFIQRLFRSNWKQEYSNTLTRRRKSNCVLKSISSKSSLSSASSCSIARKHACSMDSINFEFRASINDSDLCCVRKCCEKCFCEEGEALAANMRRKCRRKARREELTKKILEQRSQCECSGSRGSLDSACDVTSASSCDDAECRFRESSQTSMNVGTFAHIHATACSTITTDYDTLIPKYENVPTEQKKQLIEESPYDFVPVRPPRAVTEPRYENVLTVNCIDTCVFRQISSLMDSTQNQAQMVESLQQLHKNYSCVRRSSSADNEINYYYENYDDYENDLNLELERRLSD